jgi:hypothetical protein
MFCMLTNGMDQLLGRYQESRLRLDLKVAGIGASFSDLAALSTMSCKPVFSFKNTSIGPEAVKAEACKWLLLLCYRYSIQQIGSNSQNSCGYPFHIFNTRRTRTFLTPALSPLGDIAENLSEVLYTTRASSSGPKGRGLGLLTQSTWTFLWPKGGRGAAVHVSNFHTPPRRFRPPTLSLVKTFVCGAGGRGCPLSKMSAIWLTLETCLDTAPCFRLLLANFRFNR